MPDRIVRRIIAEYVIVGAAFQKGSAKLGYETALQDVLGLLNEAQRWPVNDLPLWLREWLQGVISQRVQEKDIWGGPEVASALQALQRLVAGRGDVAELISKTPVYPDYSADEMSSARITEALRAVSLDKPPASSDPNKAIIVKGPRRRPSVTRYCVFRYCVLGTGDKYHDIDVHIRRNAPKQIIQAGGRGALAATLNGCVFLRGRLFRFVSGHAARLRRSMVSAS